MAGHGHQNHPFALLRHARGRVAAGHPVALVFVTATRGGSVRLPGLRMIVDAAGQWAGSVSNGCLEADIARRAQAAIGSGRAVQLSYGRDTDPIDLRLPCGGVIDLLVAPAADLPVLDQLAAQCDRREPLRLDVWAAGRIAPAAAQSAPCADWRFTHQPPIHLVIAGTGAEASALLRLARAIDLKVTVLSPAQELTDAAHAAGASAQLLKGLGGAFDAELDRLTAVALLFHDHEWEMAILRRALASPAFYIGAMGSVRAAEQRLAGLAATHTVDPSQLARIKAPIGLIRQLRDPDLLAVSVLAEIVAEHRELGEAEAQA